MSTVKNPVVPPPSPKRKFKKRYILLGLFGLGMLANAISPTETEAERNARIANEAEQTALKLEDNKRSTLAFIAKATITEAARNPDSVSFSYVGVNKDATTVCVRYRAQNGFGGMNQEYIAFHNGKARDSAAFWNKHCTKELYNY